MTKKDLIDLIENCVVESTMSSFGEEVNFKVLLNELDKEIPDELIITKNNP